MAGAAVTCPSCGSENAPDQRFCGSCGGSLLRACPACGTENPLRFAFCGTCGASLEPSVTPAGPGAEERRIATVLFADVSGFTALSERMDPEDVKELAHDLTQQMGDVVAGFGGTVISVMGDAVMAVFGAPVAHEDDPERAVRAALAMRASLRTPDGIGDRLQLHIGINTGEVMAGLVGPEARRDYTVMGDVTNTAARLQSAAGPGEILVGATTREATARAIEYEEAAPVQAKGKEAPVPAWRAVAARGERRERAGATVPMVGRAAELDLIAATWDRVLGEEQPHLVSVLGPPGIGKSRLIRELATRIEARGRLIRGRCLPYGETTGYGAFGQQIKLDAGIMESDPTPAALQKLERRLSGLLSQEAVSDVAGHLAVLMGLSTQGSPDKSPLFGSARAYVGALAREAPTVLVFEDIHWAELALLELIQSLAGRIRGVPLLLVTLARPELLDRAPTWGGGLPRYSALPLEPLPEPDAERLARLLLSHDEEPVTLEELVRAGGGNPLFLEELAASVAERTAEAAATLPTTVQAIIAARLDALPAGERRVLQDASVVGRFFWRGALAAMSGDGAGLDDALDSLELRDFIRPQPTSRLEGDREFLFKHILTMEVAYETLPRAVRKERHATVAGYLERAAGDRVRESASLLGHHWRAAGEPGRAVPHLLTAAEVASRAWAKDQAIALYGQAMELIDPDEDPGLLDGIVLDRARVRIERGELDAAVDELGPVLDRAQGHLLGLSLLARARAANWLVDAAGVHEYGSRAADVAHEIGDVELEARSLAVLAEAAGMDGDPARGVDIAARADGAWPPDRRDGDHAYTVAQAGLMQYWCGELAEALALSQRGYELGTEASNVVATINGAAHTGLALTGLGRHEEAIGWLERAVALGEDWEPQPRFGARAVNILAGTLREVGDLVGARELSERALEMTTKAAFPGGQVSARIDLLMLDILGGDLGRAERAVPELMEAAEGTRGWHEWLWTVRLMEARAAIALAAGSWEEAVRTAEEAIARGARHGRAKYVCLSRTLHGRALAALGRAEDAATSLRTAVAEGEALGHPPTLWPALSALADTLEAAGAEAEAERVRDRARDAAQGFADSLSEERRKLAVNLPDVAQVLGATP